MGRNAGERDHLHGENPDQLGVFHLLGYLFLDPVQHPLRVCLSSRSAKLAKVRVSVFLNAMKSQRSLFEWLMQGNMRALG